MDEEITLAPTENDWLDYYEESGIMKDYCYAERQAERDEFLLWEC